MKCQVCKKREKTRVSENLYCCNSCQPPKLHWGGFVEKVVLPGYGNVEVSRLKEMERRVILKDERKDGGSYYLGRKGENGKVQDREPSY